MKTFDYALLEEMYASVCRERDALKASVPEKLPVDGMYGQQHRYAEGWNDCIDMLQSAPKPGEPT